MQGTALDALEEKSGLELVVVGAHGLGRRDGSVGNHNRAGPGQLHEEGNQEFRGGSET